MARFLLRALMSASLFATACGAAYADRIAAPPPARPMVAMAIAPDAVRAPYTVEIVADDGGVLDTFFQNGRYYVRGATNRAYTVRVVNPTAQRVEAVISIDGLDVIDGENGDLKKRGYIVPAYGEVRIDGWRTSLDNVAAFRFSAVKNSYAGRKGKARNVGVIAVAVFAEQAQAMIVAPDEPDEPYYDEDDDGYGDVERYLDRRWHPAPTNGGPAPTTTRAPRAEGAPGAADKAAESRPAPSRPAPPPPPSVASAARAVAAASVGSPRPTPCAAATTSSPAATAAVSPSAWAWAPSTARPATRPRATPASCAPPTSRSPSPSCATTTTRACAPSASCSTRPPTPAS
jgi:hypothetical protein